MKSSLTFAGASIAVVVAGVLGADLLATDSTRHAVLAAGLLVLATQLPLHFILRPWRARDDRFMAAIATGFLARAGVLALAVVFFVIPNRVAAAPFLLSLGCFLLVIVIAEAALESRRIREGGTRVTAS